MVKRDAMPFLLIPDCQSSLGPTPHLLMLSVYITTILHRWGDLYNFTLLPSRHPHTIVLLLLLLLLPP